VSGSCWQVLEFPPLVNWWLFR